MQNMNDRKDVYRLSKSPRYHDPTLITTMMLKVKLSTIHTKKKKKSCKSKCIQNKLSSSIWKAHRQQAAKGLWCKRQEDRNRNRRSRSSGVTAFQTTLPFFILLSESPEAHKDTSLSGIWHTRTCSKCILKISWCVCYQHTHLLGDARGNEYRKTEVISYFSIALLELNIIAMG